MPHKRGHSILKKKKNNNDSKKGTLKREKEVALKEIKKQVDKEKTLERGRLIHNAKSKALENRLMNSFNKKYGVATPIEKKSRAGAGQDSSKEKSDETVIKNKKGSDRGSNKPTSNDSEKSDTENKKNITQAKVRKTMSGLTILGKDKDKDTDTTGNTLLAKLKKSKKMKRTMSGFRTR
tara:strand:+ start:281 stop:817 length:537 start_codon:yes stop_codon:yes gene_type:complete